MTGLSKNKGVFFSVLCRIFDKNVEQFPKIWNLIYISFEKVLTSKTKVWTLFLNQFLTSVKIVVNKHWNKNQSIEYIC